MAEGLPITDEQRAQLSPDALRLVLEYDERYGAGNSASYGIVESFFKDQSEPTFERVGPEKEQLAPDAPRRSVGTTDADIRKASVGAINVRAKEIGYEEDTSSSAAMDKAAAEIRTLREDAETTTASGRRVRGYREEDISNAPGGLGLFGSIGDTEILPISSEARGLLRSFGRQNIKVGRSIRVEEGLEDAAIDEKQVADLRDRIVIQSKVKARKIAKDQGFVFGDASFDRVVDTEFAKIAANELRYFYRDLYKIQKAVVLSENGLDPAGDFPKERKDELLVEARERATAYYDFITPLVFEDLGEVLGSNGVPLVATEGKVARQERGERFAEGTWTKTDALKAAAFAAAPGIHGLSNRDLYTGEIAETPLGVGIRGFTGAVRVGYNILSEIFNYDVDPATGEAINPNDIRHRAAQGLDLLVPDVIQTPIQQITAAVPFLQGTHTTTGSWMQDLANSNRDGETLGADVARMSNVVNLQRRGLLPSWYDEAMGFVGEVAIPGKIFTAPFKVAKISTGTAAKGLASVSRAAKADSVAEVFDAARTWSKSSESLGDALVLKRLQREIYKEAGIPLTSSKRATIRGAVEAPDKIADMLSADLASKLMTVDRVEDIRKVFSSVKEGSYLDQIINESYSSLVDLRNLSTIRKGSKVWGEKINGLLKYKRGRELYEEMRIAGNAKALRPGIPDKVLAHRVVQGIIKHPVRRLTAEHIPDNFVYAGDSPLLVRKDVWVANQDKVNKSLKTKLKTTFSKSADLKADKPAFLKFKNGKEVADLAMKEFPRSNFANSVIKAVDKVRKGMAITRDEYNVVRSLATNSIVLDELPATAFAIRGAGEQSMVGTKAALLGQGRELTVNRYIERSVKGVRSFFGGKSDYSFVVANPDKKSLFRPHPKMFGNHAPVELTEFNTTITAQLNNMSDKVDIMLMEAIKKTGDPQKGMNAVLRRVSSGDETTDYMDIINLFFDPKGGLDTWVGSNNRLRALLKAENLPPVSISGIKQAIAMVKRKVDPRFAKELDDSGLKVKAWYGRLTGDDDFSALLSAHVTRNLSDEVYSKAVREFEELYPAFIIKTPSKLNASVRVEMFRNMAVTNGIDPKLADEMSKFVVNSFKANDSDRRSIANAIMNVMFRDGKLATQDDLMRMYEAAVDESVTGIIGQWKSGSIHDMRKGLKEFIEKNPGSPTLLELERVLVPSYVKAVAGLDMNDIRGTLSGLGARSAAGERKLIGGSLSPIDFGDNGLLFFDSRLTELSERLRSVDSTIKVEEALSKLRPSQRITGTAFLDAIQTTRKTTITGILGGSVMQGTRFLGLNALTNGLIGAITVPGYALNMALKTPSAVAQAYVRAFRKTGAIGRPGAYNPYKMMYEGNDTAIIFTTANGKVWTKQMLEEAAEKHSLRFSQVTFEFQMDTLQNSMRASKIGPKGQSVEGLLHIPGQGRVGRQRFWEFLRPDKKTVWTSVAEELDNVQRMSVFSEALRVGMKESDAAALARASLLDYANIGDGPIRQISKHMAFFAFRYNMTVETALAFLRDGKALNNMAGILGVINNQRTDMEEWVLEPDWMKTRLWKNYNGKFREWVAGSLGPDTPFSEPLGMFTNFFSFIMDSKYRESFSKSEIISGGFRGLLSDPRLQALFDIDALKSTGSAPSGYMPTSYLAAAAAFGMDEELISLFNLQRVPDSKTRQDIGFVNGKQYMFPGEDDLIMFKLFQLGALISGQKRALEDVPRILAGLGLSPDNVDWRKEALGGPLFGIGGSVGSFRDAEAAIAKLDQQLFLELRDLSKRPSTDE